MLFSLRSRAKAEKLSKFILHFIFISGYGHSTPTTIYGKLFTMCYAIIGIPLGLVMFQSIGERVNKFSSVVIRSVKTLLNCRNVQVTISLFESYILSLERSIYNSNRIQARSIETNSALSELKSPKFLHYRLLKLIKYGWNYVSVPNSGIVII